MPHLITIAASVMETLEFADGRKIGPQIGGNALYSAAGMNMWSDDVGIVSSVGAKYPNEVLEQLKNAGFDISGIKRRKSASEFRMTAIYDREGRRLYEAPKGIFFFLQKYLPGVLAKISGPIWRSWVPQAKDIPEDYLKAEGAMVGVSEYRSQAEILEKLHGKVKTIVLDLTSQVFYPHGNIPKGLADLSLADYVLPSEQELFEYFGDDTTPQEGIKRLMNMGARKVVVKLGEQGSLVFNEKNKTWVTVPIYKTKVLDPTGAGDAYGGGFLAGLTETGDAVLAAMYGTISASFIIEGYGGLFALKHTRGEAEERLNNLKKQMGYSG